jgi:hypothetical protein
VSVVGLALAGAAALSLGGATVIARQRGLGLRTVAAGWVLVAVHPGLWQEPDPADGGLQHLIACGLFTVTALGVLTWARLRPDGGTR